jgi:hypothetical protein
MQENVNTDREPAEKPKDSEYASISDRISNVLSWRPLSEGKEQPANVKYNTVNLETLTDGLTKGVNRLEKLLAKTRNDHTNATKYYLEAAGLACEMLKTVLGNDGFRKSIRKLAQVRNANEDEFVKVATNFQELGQFFETELELLNRCRIFRANEYVKVGHKALIDVLNGDARYTDIYIATDDLRKAACQLHGDLEKQTEEEKQKNLERIDKILMKVVAGTGGVLVAMVNVKFTNELGAPLAALSGHVASAIMGAAAAEAWGFIGQVNTLSSQGSETNKNRTQTLARENNVMLTQANINPSLKQVNEPQTHPTPDKSTSPSPKDIKTPNLPPSNKPLSNWTLRGIIENKGNPPPTPDKPTSPSPKDIKTQNLPPSDKPLSNRPSHWTQRIIDNKGNPPPTPGYPDPGEKYISSPTPNILSPHEKPFYDEGSQKGYYDLVKSLRNQGLSESQIEQYIKQMLNRRGPHLAKDG